MAPCIESLTRADGKINFKFVEMDVILASYFPGPARSTLRPFMTFIDASLNHFCDELQALGMALSNERMLEVPLNEHFL